MELMFTKGYHASVFVGREATKDWGYRTSPWNAELWLGRTYVCASFNETRIKRSVRWCTYAVAAFYIGWLMPSPLQPAEAEQSRPAQFLTIDCEADWII